MMVPRCRHGNIFLGCDVEPCEEQDNYLKITKAKLEEWHETNELPRLPLDSDIDYQQ